MFHNSIIERELTLAVVGARYPNANGSNRQFYIMMCRPGDAIELRPEPKNKFDEHAIAVFSCGKGAGQLGYLRSERAVFVGARIREAQPISAIFQDTMPSGAMIRVRIGGGEPTLPQPPAARPLLIGGGGFYPDPDGPECGA